MSNPTSNFGWQMPTPTDLVTDLPADFEVFGQAVDTSLADLKGGTTGQVLSKNSNTDMDFVWVTDAAGDITGVTAGTGISGGGTSGTVTITNSMATEITAKGDLIVGTGSATFDNLAAGSNGSTLVADSAATTGLRYSATPSASNPVINSAFQVFQRGTTTTLTSTSFVADRWQAIRSVAGATGSRQVTGDTTNLPNIQYCLRVARDSGNTSTSVIALGQNMESVNSIPFAGKSITYSFYARAGANFSQASGALNVYLTSGTGTDQNNVTGSFTGATQVVNSTATLTTTWQRFTFTGTVAATATQLGPQWQFTPVGTAGANDYFEVTGVQIDIGSVALPFRTYAATIQGELAACQRYYYRITGTNTFSNICPAYTDATNNAVTTMTLPVELRVAPTSVDFSNIRVTNFSGASAVTSAAVSSVFNGKNNTGINLGVAGNPFTAFAPYVVSCNNSAAGYLGVSAEL